MEDQPWEELEKMIRGVITELLEMTITPHVRELRAKAVTYGRVIHNWQTYPPTAPQVQAMQECVEELYDKVRTAKREVSRVSRKPSASPTERVDKRSLQVPASAPPWNHDSKDATGIRPRRSVAGASHHPSAGPSNAPTAPTVDRANAPTTRPPAAGDEAGITVPPLSAPRTIDTPTPALLRSRRSR